MSAFFHSGSYSFPRFTRTPFITSLLLTCIYALTTLVYYSRIQPVVPLFYSLAQATEYLAPKIWIFVFPSMSAVMLLIHIWILRFIHTHDRLIILVFCWMTVILQLLIGIALFRILLLIL